MAISQKNRYYWGLVVLIVLLLQIAWPIVSDEAYFIAWGKTFSLGFYDHPPLPGWISYVLQQIGHLIGLKTQGPLHRLFSLGLGAGSLWLVARRLGHRPDGGRYAIIALALIPGWLILFNLYLNDTILAFMVLLFLLATEAAFLARRRVWLWIILAGLAFAGVLLTKYSGAVIWLGMVAALLSWPAGRRFLVGRMVLISLVALGPFLLHLWWNLDHCNATLAFNFVFRNSRAPGYGPLWLLLTLAIMAGPVGFMALYQVPRQGRSAGFFGRVFLGSVAVMLVISLWRHDFGVNWGAPLGFMAVLALAETGRWRLLRGSRLPAALLSGLTLLPLGALVLGLQLGLVPAGRIFDANKARSVDLILDLGDGSLAAALRPLAAGRVMAVMEYGVAASLDNAGFSETVVLSRSVFGRNQDLFTDFRALDGRNFLLLAPDAKARQALATNLFDSFELRVVTTARRRYPVILGQGFRYENYRKTWILPVLTEFYDRSPLPYWRCAMDRYR